MKKKMTKYTNEDREPYLGLYCKGCIDLERGEGMKCPSCDQRYDKLASIDKLLDGEESWDDFADTFKRRELRRESDPERYDWENDPKLPKEAKEAIREMIPVLHTISLQIEDIDSPAVEITPEQREKAREISRILKEHCETLDIKICMDNDWTPGVYVWELYIFGSLEYTRFTDREHQVLDMFGIGHGAACTSISLDELDNWLDKLKGSDEHE